MITPEEATKKMEDSIKRSVEEMNISLYKRFGYPEIEEIGIEYGDFFLQSIGEMYTLEKDQFSNTRREYRAPSGNATLLFNRQDIIKLCRIGIDAVELMITRDKKILLVLHYSSFGEEKEKWDQI